MTKEFEDMLGGLLVGGIFVLPLIVPLLGAGGIRTEVERARDDRSKGLDVWLFKMPVAIGSSALTGAFWGGLLGMFLNPDPDSGLSSFSPAPKLLGFGVGLFVTLFFFAYKGLFPTPPEPTPPE